MSERGLMWLAVPEQVQDDGHDDVECGERDRDTLAFRRCLGDGGDHFEKHYELLSLGLLFSWQDAGKGEFWSK